MKRPKVIAAVDIGTAKTACVVGEVDPPNPANILGKAIVASQGVRKGEVVDINAAGKVVKRAIGLAEKEAGVYVDSVYLALTGGHLSGFANEGTATISHLDGLVREEDKAKAVADAKRRELPPSRKYIHHLQTGFTLDGKSVNDPLTLQGETLKAGYWHIHGDERRLADHIHVVNRVGFEVEDIAVSSIATGTMLLDETEKETGALLLDIGCGTTDFALFRNNRVLRTGTLAVGGDHITNDLSVGLRLGYEQAEKIKLSCAKAVIDPMSQGQRIMIMGDTALGQRTLPRSSIFQVTNLRVMELLSLVKRELGSDLNPHFLQAGVIMTGGTSQLSMIAVAAAKAFNVPVRLTDTIPGVEGDFGDTRLATAMGLLQCGLTPEMTIREKANRGPKVAQLVAGLFN